MQITRRPARAADADPARRIHHDAYRAVVERQFGPWDEAAQDRFFGVAWAAAAHEMVECDGQPCGYVCIEERADDIHVREIVVAPGFQGRGIGSTLLRAVLDRAHARGVPVRLGTFHANRAAALYRRLGFREIGHTATHILLEWRGDRPAAPEEAT
jgi:ribosomal protein S18 acetylase RimI-like enzyme